PRCRPYPPAPPATAYAPATPPLGMLARHSRRPPQMKRSRLAVHNDHNSVRKLWHKNYDSRTWDSCTAGARILVNREFLLPPELPGNCRVTARTPLRQSEE